MKRKKLSVVRGKEKEERVRCIRKGREVTEEVVKEAGTE